MSLIRQVWLLLLGVLLMALVGSLATLALTTRDSLQTHLRVRNADAATMLALALSQQQGDPALMQLVAMAQFDTGHYRLIRLVAPSGEVLFERKAEAQSGNAPAWFANAFAISADPGAAQVTAGWRSLGRLEVSAQAAWALDALWAGCVRAVGLLTLLGLAAAGVAAMAVRTWRRPLDATVAQAHALEEGRFTLAEEPRAPELQRVARSMNAMVRRLQLAFQAQAEQVQALRIQATTDPVTGLVHRRHFINQVDATLRAVHGRGGGLLIIRLRHLQSLNQRLGHDATDRLLSTIADVLQAYPRSAAGALCGRLSGSDFGLFLPAPGLVVETASSLILGLRAALATIDPEAHVVIGGADPLHGNTVVGALTLADSALLRAEHEGPFAVEVATVDRPDEPLQGEQSWRDVLVQALQQGRVELAMHPVLDRAGRRLYQDCSLRVQLLAGGPYEVPQVWLWMALRAHLNTQADLTALGLALEAMRADPRPCCVHVAGASLLSPGFIGQVAQVLSEVQLMGAQMTVEVKECVTLEQTRCLADAARAWRSLGARLGLEHAGAALQDMSRLGELGVDYIKVDERYVHGIGQDQAVREFARSLVTMAHSMGVQVIAGGVDEAEDLRAIWAIGFDGATGAALTDV